MSTKKDELQAQITYRLIESLSASEKRYETLVENIQEVVFESDLKGTFKFLNSAWQSALGRSVKESLGRSLYDFVFEDDKESCLKLFNLEKERGSRRRNTLRFLHKKGHLLWLAVSVTSDGSGNVSGSLHDITERKQAMEEIKRLNAELEQRVIELETANRELKDFAYIVSHDLKAPLRAISQLAGWISRDCAHAFDEEGKEQMDLLIGRAKRMDALIDGILQYSRVGRIRGEEEHIDLNELVRDGIEMIAPPDHIQVTIENELPTIVGDRIHIEQVFQNLLGNAIKFMDKSRGEVKVGCVDEGDHWKFSVADNGTGIDEKYHERIFQVFQTLTPRDERESTGIGLAIVKKIIELRGGEIWVESEVGAGTMFFFTLPKKEGENAG